MSVRTLFSMIGTKCSKLGSLCSGRNRAFVCRLVLFTFCLVAGLLLLTWIKAEARSQMSGLRQHFAAIPADYFSVHDRLQMALPSLNSAIIDFVMRRNLASRDRFRREARALQDALNSEKRLIDTAAERVAFGKMEQLFKHYVDNAENALQAQNASSSTGEIYESLQRDTFRLQSAINDLSQTQNQEFATLLGDAQNRLLHLENLLIWTVFILWSAAILLAVIGYTGIIAPLRNRLTETDAIIQRQEKLASLGVLAAGVAHEIRNPLTAIKFRLFSLHQELPGTEQSEDAKVIENEINRLDRIVRDFLQFARPSDPDLVFMPASQIATHVSALMASPLEKRGIELKTNTAPDVWLHADAQQIEQVLINLIQNAAESIGTGGAISLGIRNASAVLNGIAMPVVILAVTDTGKGIPPEVEKRLFDPFFTTKEEGTGLGLAMSARIVSKHGGLLRYQTKTNQGTTFEIVLPAPTFHASETIAH